MPETLTVPTLVMPSEAPLSVAKANVGVAAMVSTVMAAALLDGVAVVLLAKSVCLTWMAPAAYVALAPSVKLLTLAACAALQVVPPLVLYCQVAPASMPETLTVPTLVMPSLAPLSVARVKVGAAGAAVSTACRDVAAALLPWPAASVATPAATLTLMLPLKPELGVTTRL